MRKYIATVVLVVVLAACGICQDKNIIPVKVERNKTLITVKIGNTIIPNIILDTGFPYDGIMIYKRTYNDSLDLSRAVQAQLGGAGSGDASQVLMLDSAVFSVGDVTMRNQRIILFQSDIYKGFPSNGITGYSIFGHYATEFDYDKSTMTLHDSGNYQTDSAWTVVPLYFKNNNIPWFDASVVIDEENPITLSVYIDFAAGEPILLLDKPDMKFRMPDKTDSIYIGRGLSGDIYGKKGTISKLIIGGYEMKDVIASIASAKVRSKQENADAIIGNGALRRFNLVFDYANKKLFLKPNTHFNDPY